MSGESTTLGSWHQDEASLLAIARRARSGVPVIPGYGDLVELKRGGQGVVYSAVQRSTHRKVAIKVLLAGHLASEAQKRRFERETELAASLRHPNVVRIYDSGVTGEGWAYLVMEYVDGRAIDEHARSLTGVGRARALVGVFTKVCDAVAHAHQRGVIHRDLKPSNIRVDDAGEPHVLDFGLAKLEGGQETREVSVSGQFLGSLPWASPEQADGADAVDVRSDVYSLGVVLYQLLSGRLPYDVEGSMTRALENIRGATPLPLEGAGVDEDLATIVLKCLVKEPTGRYQSAGEIGVALRSWLAGEPIVATRESGWRSMRRRLRRFRAIAIVSSVGGVLLAATAVLALRFANQASLERKAAQQQAERSQASLDFITGTIQAANPDTPGGGRNATIGELLDRASGQIPEKYKGKPDLQAHLHDVLGRTYTQMGEFDRAREQFDKAVPLFEEVEGKEGRRTLSARAHAAEMLAYLGRYAEAEPIYREVESVQARLFPADDTDLLATRNDLSVVYRRTNRIADAERMLRLCREHAKDRTTDNYFITLANHGSALMDLGKLDEAEAAYRSAYEGLLAKSGPDASLTINIGSSYSTLLIQRDRAKEACAILERAYAAATRTRGETDPLTMVVGHNLAKAYHDSDRLDDARRVGEAVLAAREKKLGTTNEYTLITKGNLAAVLAEQGEHETALRLSEEIYETEVANRGRTDQSSLIALNNVARSNARCGKFDAANARYAELLETAKALPEGHWLLGLFQSNAGKCLLDQKRFADAEPLLRAAYPRLLEKLGAGHRHTRASAENLALLMEATGRSDEARSIREAAGAKK